LITAHMIIFWLSQTSNVTPPIALAAFAGAGVAGAAPLPSAVTAFKLAGGLFVIPLMMAYSSLLLVDGRSWSAVLGAAGITLAVIIATASAVERYLFGPLSRTQALMCWVAAGCLLYPDQYSRAIGLVMCAVVMIVNYRASRAYAGARQ